MEIPLVDLTAQYESIAVEIEEAIHKTVERKDFILGEGVSGFESEFAHFCGVNHCAGVGSGTDALQLACRALDIGPGDEVIVPAYTFIATALGVTLAGARPVLADVDPKTYLIDPAKIETAITPRTRAVIPVHIFGQCADMPTILDIAADHNLSVIEDAAQAHGATLEGRQAGSWGDMGCFSFYPGKNLGCYGDGGAVTTDRDDLAEALRSIRNLGSLKKGIHDRIGINSRLDSLQARVLSVKLRYLQEWNSRRRSIASCYSSEITKQLPDLGVPKLEPNREHVFHLYVVSVPQRDRVLEHLRDRGVSAGIHYPFAIHEHEAYRNLGYSAGSYPVAEQLARSCLSLPIYPELSEDQSQSIVRALGEAQALSAHASMCQVNGPVLTP